MKGSGTTLTAAAGGGGYALGVGTCSNSVLRFTAAAGDHWLVIGFDSAFGTITIGGPSLTVEFMQQKGMIAIDTLAAGTVQVSGGCWDFAGNTRAVRLNAPNLSA